MGPKAPSITKESKQPRLLSTSLKNANGHEHPN
jgi:hypothetical protein